jgi:hypothetical protein
VPLKKYLQVVAIEKGCGGGIPLRIRKNQKRHPACGVTCFVLGFFLIDSHKYSEDVLRINI